MFLTLVYVLQFIYVHIPAELHVSILISILLFSSTLRRLTLLYVLQLIYADLHVSYPALDVLLRPFCRWSRNFFPLLPKR